MITLRKFYILSTIVCGLLVSSLKGQDDPLAVIKVNVKLVEVYATVYDHHGSYVDGLTRDRFEVFDNGAPEPISTFETTNNRLSCAVLLDTTGSMTWALPKVKNSVVKLIDELGENDSVAIYSFDEHLVLRQDFTTDKAAAKRAVLRTRAEGGTALFDAISEVARDISKRPGKKAMVVFTDGDDNSSVLNATAAVSRAKKSGVPLYAIAEGEAQRSPQLKKILEELSQQSGGSAYQVKKDSEIDDVFDKIARDLQHLYLISYKPPPNASDNSWHKIDLAVRGIKDYRIRAKAGYYPD